ncbi:hypothetical protein Tco_0378567 [Tanacetum coccineum]
MQMIMECGFLSSGGTGVKQKKGGNNNVDSDNVIESGNVANSSTCFNATQADQYALIMQPDLHTVSNTLGINLRNSNEEEADIGKHMTKVSPQTGNVSIVNTSGLISYLKLDTANIGGITTCNFSSM